jgi:hypothetical protein
LVKNPPSHSGKLLELFPLVFCGPQPVFKSSFFYHGDILFFGLCKRQEI